MSAFDFEPHLSDDVVLLRPMRADDWAVLFAAASDPAIWTVHPAWDRWQEGVFRAFFDRCLRGGGSMVICDAASGEVLGMSRFGCERAEAGEVEIGWTFLVRARWGDGTNRRVKRLMVGHALGQFERVIFLVGEDNVRSRRAMEKIGGRLMPRDFVAEMAGKPVRHVIYGIDANGFAAGLGQAD